MLDLNTLSLESLFAELTRDGCLTRLLQLARDEDLGPNGIPGDITSRACIAESQQGRADLVARESGFLCGVRTLPELLRLFAPDVALHMHVADGDRIAKGDTLAVLQGSLRQILAAERTLLNLLSRLSGIATRTAEFAKAIEGSRAKLLDTRKTTPGLRNLEKYAVRCGGGLCHRIGLFDAVLIKDNHIAGIAPADLPRFIEQAAAKARALAQEVGGLRFIELEVDSLAQLEAMLAAKLCGQRNAVGIILLDNMSTAQLREAAALRDRHAPDLRLEASGGVTLNTIRAIAETGVDRISVGGLTHHAVSLDLALDVDAGASL